MAGSPQLHRSWLRTNCLEFSVRHFLCQSSKFHLLFFISCTIYQSRSQVPTRPPSVEDYSQPQGWSICFASGAFVSQMISPFFALIIYSFRYIRRSLLSSPPTRCATSAGYIQSGTILLLRLLTRVCLLIEAR
jgi:hypothetical protein